MAAADDYLKWRKGPPVGCMFARRMSNRPKEFGQRIEVVPITGTPSRIAAVVAQRIDAHIADPAAAAATLLFPDVESLEYLARIMLALHGLPHWTVSTAMLQPPPAREMVTLHIAREIPFRNAWRSSEALVLGPYPDFFPPTRRAPIAAMEIFVGEPFENDPKTGLPTSKANLAHIRMNFPSPTAFDKTWDNSIAGRTRSLGGDDNRAKAKVSLTISLPMAKRLGCAP